MRLQRRSATIRLMVDASRVQHETVGVLSNTERGLDMFTSGHTYMRVALLKTRLASSKSELESVLPRFLSDNNNMMSGGQW